MTANSLVLGVFKPALRKKLEFKELHSVTFKANKITDTLDLSGMGTTKENFNLHERKCETLKLSENGEFVDMFLKQVNNKVKMKELNASYLFIDFVAKRIETTLFYVNENDMKCKKVIDLDF